jgi:valyl-tRNA synthetase
MVAWNQVVVEKKTMKEQKKTRHDLGRDQFVAEVLDNPPLFVLIIFCRC